MKTTVNKSTKAIVEHISDKLLEETLGSGDPKYIRRETKNGFEIYTKNLDMDIFLKTGVFQHKELIVFKAKKSTSGNISFSIDDSIVGFM